MEDVYDYISSINSKNVIYFFSCTLHTHISHCDDGIFSYSFSHVLYSLLTVHILVDSIWALQSWRVYKCIALSQSVECWMKIKLEQWYNPMFSIFQVFLKQFFPLSAFSHRLRVWDGTHGAENEWNLIKNFGNIAAKLERHGITFEAISL